MTGIGALSKADAIATGCVGPIARACGVDYDVRKDYPYSVYPEVEFDVPLGTTGDCYDRYLCRVEEIKQSIRILRQCFAQIPEGSHIVCTVTGHGLKDPDAVKFKTDAPVQPNESSVLRAIGF